MKTVVQLLMAVVAAVSPLLTNGEPLGLVGWINVGVVAAGAVTVYIAANSDTGIWSVTKMFMSLISAVGVAMISLLADGSLSGNDWMQIGAAVIATIAVFEFPKGVELGGSSGRNEAT